MNQSDDANEGHRFRLDGPDGPHWLKPGNNAIGSSPRNDIVLAMNGVSRHHATAVLASGSLVVRDLDSKNGTLVNGTAVTSSPLAVGDELGLGPARFTLTALDDDDAELGIECARPMVPAPNPARSRPTATLLGSDRARERDQVQFVGDFLVALVAANTGREAALVQLVDLLDAQGCALIERGTHGPPAVLAAAGGMGHWPKALDEVSARASGAGSGADDWPTLQGAGCFAVFEHQQAGALGLAAFGVPESAGDPTPLLGTLLRLVVHGEGRRATPPAARDERAWQLPEGIVPSVTPEMRTLYEQIALLRQGDLPVLILGESGVGKEHIAHLIHNLSERRGRPFVAINCAAIPSELLEAEMFGIGRGVATGVSPREGKFQMADRGTLFLDEIGDMSPELQAKLLRALQEHEIVPLGREPVRVDVRVVAATHTDLQQRLAEGGFRHDLYYRLAGYEIEVPPLRHRRDDLPALIGHFVRQYSQEIGKSIRGVSVKALRRLSDYPWPGNVRELMNIVRRLVYVCPDGQTIEAARLPPTVTDPQPTEPSLDDLRQGTASLPQHLAAIERQMIRRAMDATHGNQTQAAKLLGISRNGLAYRTKRLGLDTSEH